jgi:outer membrane receptor protein involved in Fe transport
MKPTPHTPADRVRKSLAFGLAALLTATGASGQTDADTLRRLQEENAALRRQLAELQGRPATTPSAPATPAAPATQPSPVAPTASQPTPPADPGVVSLSPFEVSSERDYGYVRTNSLTATRIGARIMDTPLQIQVLSEDFLADTNMTDLQDVLRYSATAAGDNAMGVLQPATGFTPSGNVTTRGFPINARLRNSIRRYNVYSLDNVERVELIRGPASVFFGQSFPGGVINYVTKQPEFRDIPTSMSYRWTTDGGNKATFDQNTVLSTGKVAMRNFISWENSSFQRDFESRQGYTILPQIKVRVNDKIDLRAELEYTTRKENLAAQGWIWPQQWFDDYQNPRVELMNAAGIDPSLPLADRQALYRTRIGDQRLGNWITDVRNAAGDQGIPLYTNDNFNRGAVFNRLAGLDFNPWGAGTTTDEEVTNIQVVLDARPFEWLNSRFTWNRAHAYYYERKSQARPNADGQTYNTLVGLTWRFYDVAPEDFILDNVVSFDIGPTKNKLLFGGIYRTGDNQFGGSSPFGPDFSDVPGIDNASPYNLQALRDRNGNPMTARQVFEQYDPTIHPFPNIASITEKDRPLIDRYKPKNEEYYINYQGKFFEDRLNVMAGYREEKTYNRQQQFAANPPWYPSFDNMLEVVDPADYPLYQISESYQRSLLSTQTGDSIQYGATFALTPDVNLYAGYSQSYLPNGGAKAIYDPILVRQRAQELGLNPDTELSRIQSEGADDTLGNEEGTNMEIGIKTTLFDSKIVATAALFHLERTNRRTDDVPRQTDERLNYTAAGTSSQRVRWFSAQATQETEGFEAEVIWTPNRQYQLVASGGWMWDAETTKDPSISDTNINRDAIFNARLAYAPEYSLNLWNKYSFNDGALRGLMIGGGLRYRSEIVVSNSRDWNPNRDGVTAGDYTVFDLLVGYNTELWGIDTSFNLNVTNLFDKLHSEGGWNYARGREIALTTRVSF